MTSEKMYETVIRLMRAHDAQAKTRNTDDVFADPNASLWPYLPFWGDAAELLKDAMRGMDKSATGAGRAAAIQRIYRSARGYHNERLHGTFRSGDRWAICDGFRYIRLNEKPRSIPETTCDVDLDRVTRPEDREGEPVDLPTVAQIKAHIAEKRALYGRGWAKQRDAAMEALPGWWCNPQYLLDMVQSLPGGVAHRPAKALSPLYYDSADGDAVLLPVRPRSS